MTKIMTITIIGIGLIGGSMAISLKENGFADHVIGVDASRTSLDKALRRRIIDEACELDEGLSKADLVIVATPVDVAMEVLPQILPQVKNQVVMDVGSTKQRLLDLVGSLPNRSRLVATHPMAGTEHSGIEAAIPRLFEGKYTVICEAEKSDADAVALVERMYQSLGMKIAHLNGQEHDVHTAYVSHISHISSFALALTVLEKERDEQAIFELASSGFASTVRLAKSSPEMWTPIFRQNRDNVLDVLDEHISVLSRFRSLLIKKDFEAIRQLMVEANDIRRILP
jgi:prephenate dehydrogenase